MLEKISEETLGARYNHSSQIEPYKNMKIVYLGVYFFKISTGSESVVAGHCVRHY